MNAKQLTLALISALVLATGCGDDDTGAGAGDGGAGTDAGPPAPRPECENINASNCLLPWPSSRYLAEDATTATGFRVAIPIEAMPTNQERTPVDPEIFARFDGFSPMTSAMTYFPGRVDESELPDEHHIEDSLAATSPTVLLDAESGERVAHFAERDGWRNASTSVLYIRPAVRLAEDHRYIVAIRGLRLDDGTAIEPSDYFRALRDGDSHEDPSVEQRRAHFEDIFTKLESAGVERAGLLEAWDFHTSSGEALWGDLISMRDQALETVGERGIGCTVTSVEDDVDENLWRRVEGTVTVPLFMQSAEPGALVVRDAEGMPTPTGTTEVPFMLHIPQSVKTAVEEGGDGGALLTYGHGLFGSRDGIDRGWLRQWQNDVGMVTVATDWWGMSADDVVVAADALTEMSDFPRLAERLLQGVINVLVMTRSFAGVCSELAEVQAGGAPLIDTTQRYYLGVSQGGIMGATLAGVSTDIDRFVLQVGGISYPIMMKRSTNFGVFAAIMDTWYKDPVDADLLLVMSAPLWDLAEPSTYAPHLVSDPLPGTPAKHILYQTGWYDAQVPNISSDIAARTMGIPLMVPTVREVWNIEETSGPAPSAYVQYRIDGVEAWAPGTRSPTEGNPAHEGVRRNPAAQHQMDAFLRPDGTIQHLCDGPCDPE